MSDNAGQALFVDGEWMPRPEKPPPRNTFVSLNSFGNKADDLRTDYANLDVDWIMFNECYQEISKWSRQFHSYNKSGKYIQASELSTILKRFRI